MLVGQWLLYRAEHSAKTHPCRETNSKHCQASTQLSSQNPSSQPEMETLCDSSTSLINQDEATLILSQHFVPSMAGRVHLKHQTQVTCAATEASPHTRKLLGFTTQPPHLIITPFS